MTEWSSREPGAAAAQRLVIRETFAAPRERVFDAWVKPDLLARWFAPRGCTLRIEHAEVRPGGSFHWCVSNPSFGDCWTVGSYLEVVRPERLVFTWAIADAEGRRATPESQGHDPEWPAETLVKVTFSQTEGQTTVTLEQGVDEALARRTGAHPGWLQMLARLGDLLAAGEA